MCARANLCIRMCVCVSTCDLSVEACMRVCRNIDMFLWVQLTCRQSLGLRSLECLYSGERIPPHKQVLCCVFPRAPLLSPIPTPPPLPLLLPPLWFFSFCVSSFMRAFMHVCMLVYTRVGACVYVPAARQEQGPAEGQTPGPAEFPLSVPLPVPVLPPSAAAAATVHHHHHNNSSNSKRTARTTATAAAWGAGRVGVAAPGGACALLARRVGALPL